MDTNKERFLLAKINLLENVNAQLLVAFSAIIRTRAPSWQEDLEHNLRKSCRERLVLRDGTGEGALELQTEMLKQVDNFFFLVRHYSDNTTPKT